MHLIFPQGATVTIGNFDGVHPVHKHIRKNLKNEADSRNLPVIVVIFEPQPKEFFLKQALRPMPHRPFAYQADLAERYRLYLTPYGCCVSTKNLLNERTGFHRQTVAPTLHTRYLLIGATIR